MPVFALTDELVFPDPRLAHSSGLLAVGGDLRAERLLLAYSLGIFPWPVPNYPLAWFSPDPRMVLRPRELRVSRSMRGLIRKGTLEVRVDTAFEQVARRCAEPDRRREYSTWITPEMLDAYVELHELGFAHSFEAWCDGALVGGLYGVSLGAGFFGESMFFDVDNASKVAFVSLVRQTLHWGFSMIDCQVHTAHLERLGAVEIPREEFLTELNDVLEQPTRRGPWKLESGPR